MKKVIYKYINRHGKLEQDEFMFTEWERFGYLLNFRNAKTHREIVISNWQFCRIEEVN